jgi:hypothetical protein
MNSGVTGYTIGGEGIKSAVPGRSKGVTTETEIGNTLIDQHMSVGAAMDIVTDSTAFNPGSFMLI